MKYTYLTHLVTIALMAATAFANVIPAEKIGAPHPAKRAPPPLPTLPVGTPLDPSGSSSSPLDALSTLGGPLNKAGPNPGLTKRGGDHDGERTQEHNLDDDRREARYLNLALLLEDFLVAFFERGLGRYSQQHFQRAGYPDWVRGRYEQILEHEKHHKEFLQSAITASGGEYARGCNYNFNDNDVHSFIDYSEALETIAASAYTGALQYLDNRAYITAGASILAVEARHASWINSAVRKQNPWNTAFETPLTPNEVATLLSTFFEWDSCPEGNRDILPELLHPYPRLYLSPRLVPGQQAEISFSERNRGGDNNNRNDRLYAAFLTGIETIFVPVEERENGNDNHEHEGQNGNNGGNNGNNNGGNGGNGGKGGNSGNGGNGGNNRNNNGGNRNNNGGGSNNNNGGNNDNDRNRNNENNRGGNNNNGGNNFPGNNNGGYNDNDNNRRRYFVEIPHDLEARGTVYVIIVRGSDDIHNVNLDDENIVAGPAIAMFPFDAHGKPIGW